MSAVGRGSVEDVAQPGLLAVALRASAVLVVGVRKLGGDRAAALLAGIGAIVAERSISLSSSPRSSQTPRHCGQWSISTPWRSLMTSAVSVQLGHFKLGSW